MVEFQERPSKRTPRSIPPRLNDTVWKLHLEGLDPPRISERLAALGCHASRHSVRRLVLLLKRIPARAAHALELERDRASTLAILEAHQESLDDVVDDMAIAARKNQHERVRELSRTGRLLLRTVSRYDRLYQTALKDVFPGRAAGNGADLVKMLVNPAQMRARPESPLSLSIPGASLTAADGHNLHSSVRSGVIDPASPGRDMERPLRGGPRHTPIEARMRRFLSEALPIALTLTVALVPFTARAADQVIHPKGQSKRPALISDGKGGLHVAYVSFETGKDVPDIFYSRSKDGGATWSPGIEVSNTPGISDAPAIAASGDEVVIVWQDTTSGEERPDIYAVRSEDGGATWSKSVNVSRTPRESSAAAVCIGATGALHVAWRQQVGDEGEYGILYSESLDHGKHWSRGQNVSRMFGVAADPALACGPKGEVFLTWAHKQKGEENADIWFMRALDGETRMPPVNASNSPGTSSRPAVTLDAKGNIYLAWEESTTEDLRPDIFVTVSRDGGQTFDKYHDVAPTPGISGAPKMIAASDGHIAIAWQDTAGSAEAPDIWVAVSTDMAKTFTTPSNVSNSPGVSVTPGVAIVKGKVVAVWEELDKDQKHVRVATTALAQDARPAK